MTKYYFISYIYQTATGLAYASCLYKAENRTLMDICFDIAKARNVSAKSVVITHLKDLSKKEYKMLKGEE